MSMKDLLLSFKGRIGRKTYWIWNIFYYIAITGFATGISVLFPAYSYLLLPIFLLLLVIPDLAVTAKRWHDRNKSNYWLLLNVPLVLGATCITYGCDYDRASIAYSHGGNGCCTSVWFVDLGRVRFDERH